MKQPTQNEPQLSAEMETDFDDKWNTLDKNGGFIHMLTLNTHNPEAIKHFLATALEEQRATERTRTIEEVLGIASELQKLCDDAGGIIDATTVLNELRAKLEAMKGKHE